MRTIAIICLFIFMLGLLTAQDLQPWQFVRHSAVDNNGQVHVRFNGAPSMVTPYELYNWQNNAWQQMTLNEIEPLVQEALLPAAMGQTLKYRLRTNYEYMGENITAVNPAFFSTDTFPPALASLGYIADDPVGDSINVYFPNLDITGNWFGYSDNKLYCAMSNQANNFSPFNSFTSYNLYFAGLANTATAIADSSVYAMIYTFNIPGVISPGLYKFGLNLADTTVVYEYLAPIQTQTLGGKLYMSCNISDLTADPNFGSWPPEFNSLGFMSGSLRINIDTVTLLPSFGIGDLSGIAQLIFENHSYTIGQNAMPQILNPIVTGQPGSVLVRFDYFDANHDFPLYAKMLLLDTTTEVDFIPQSLDFSQPVTMTAMVPPGMEVSSILIKVSDNNIYYTEYYIDIANDDLTMPSAFSFNAYPNPFNPSLDKLSIILNGVKGSQAEIGIYNLKGQCVKHFKPSQDRFWDGTSDNNLPVPAGVYLLRVADAGRTAAKKILILR